MKADKIRETILGTVDTKRNCFSFADILNAFEGKKVSKEEIKREIKYLAGEELITGEIDENNFIMKRHRDDTSCGHSIQVLEVTSKGRNWLENKQSASLAWRSNIGYTVLGGVLTWLAINLLSRINTQQFFNQMGAFLKNLMPKG
jgi:hypothetical protein